MIEENLFPVTILACGVMLIALVWWWNYGRSPDLELAESERERYDEWLRKAVMNGTHNREGKPLCRICGDKDDADTVATAWGSRTKRGEGLWAWYRSWIGAPARYKVVEHDRDGDAAYDYCDHHAILVREELRAYLLRYEQKRLDALVDAEVELTRFEQKGLDEVVKTRVAQHDKEVRPKKGDDKAPAKVVALR